MAQAPPRGEGVVGTLVEGGGNGGVTDKDKGNMWVEAGVAVKGLS